MRFAAVLVLVPALLVATTLDLWGGAETHAPDGTPLVSGKAPALVAVARTYRHQDMDPIAVSLGLALTNCALSSPAVMPSSINPIGSNAGPPFLYGLISLRC